MKRLSKNLTIFLIICFIVLSSVLKFRIMRDFTYLTGDAARYMIEARNFMNGRGILDDFIQGYLVPNAYEGHVPIYAFTEPLNPVLLAAFCWATSTDIFHGWMLQPLFFSAVNIFLIYIIMMRLFPVEQADASGDKKASQIFTILSPALICSGLVAFQPQLFNIGTLPYSETAFTSILLFGFYVLIRLDDEKESDKKALLWCCLLGVICGTAFLQRFHGITFLPAVVLSVVMLMGFNKKSIVGIALVGTFFLVALIPHFILMGMYEGDMALPFKVIKSMFFEPRPWQEEAQSGGFIMKILGSLINLWRALNFRWEGSLFATFGHIIWLSIFGILLLVFPTEEKSHRRKLFFSAGLIIFFAVWAIATQPKLYYLYLNYRGTYPYVVFFLIFSFVLLIYLQSKKVARAFYIAVLLLFLVAYIRTDFSSKGFQSWHRSPRIFEPVVDYLKNDLTYDDTIILSSRADYFALYANRRGVFVFPTIEYDGLRTLAANYDVTHLIVTSIMDKSRDFAHLLDVPESELPKWLTLEKEFKDHRHTVRVFKIHRDALL